VAEESSEFGPDESAQIEKIEMVNRLFTTRDSSRLNSLSGLIGNG
jgi:hypothetical protein